MTVPLDNLPWHRRRLLRAGSAVVAFGVVAVATRALLSEELEPARALAMLREVQHRWWAWPVFFAAYVGLTSAFVPVTLFHMLSGAVLGFRTALVANLVAHNLTSNLQFFFARRALRGRAIPGASVGPVPGGRLARIEQMLEREGLRAAILVRVLPIPNLAVSLTAGVSTLRWRDFALGTAIGGAPIIAIYTWFAASLVEGLAEARRDALIQSIVAGVALAVVVLGSRWLGRRRGT